MILALIFLLAFAGPATAAVGYAPRPCGFDLDGDRVRGEPEDCSVCDGSTVDVNGDGVSDRMVYVDCDFGSADGDGSPADPFATIAGAMDSLVEPGEGVLQAVCFRGTCGEMVEPAVSGAEGSFIAERFAHPSFPTLLSGWDSDADGIYPPFDADDEAVLLGGPGRPFAIVNAGMRSRLEFAHFRAVGFGQDCSESSAGFMKPALGVGSVDHISVHDVELIDINRGCAPSASRAVFLLALKGSRLKYFLIENVLLADYGGYAIRGSGVGTDAVGRYRFRHLTVRPRGPVGGFAHGIKLWDHIQRIEVLDSLFDANPWDWSPCASSVATNGCEPTYAITAAQCSGRWTIRGNEFRDWKYAISVQPDAGSSFCQDRDIRRVSIRENLIRNDYAPWHYGDFGIRIRSGSQASVRWVDISRNELRTSVGWEACIWSDAGSDVESSRGTVRIYGNLCEGPANRYAALTIGTPSDAGGEPTYPHQYYQVRRNVFTGVGSTNVSTAYDIQRFVASRNIYDPDAGFSWGSHGPGAVPGEAFPTWLGDSGEDSSSVACEVDTATIRAECR